MNGSAQLEEAAVKKPMATFRTSASASLGLIGLLAWACSGAPAATQPGTVPTAGTTPAVADATAAAPRATPTVSTATPTDLADTPAPPAQASTPPDFAVVPASEDASATVQLGGQTYLLEARAVPDPAVAQCSLGDGFVMVGLTSADQQSLLVIFASYAGVGGDGSSFYLQIAIPSEQRAEHWAPTETVPFNVTGSTATWSGTMEERLGTGREEQVAITIDCAN